MRFCRPSDVMLMRESILAILGLCPASPDKPTPRIRDVSERRSSQFRHPHHRQAASSSIQMAAHQGNSSSHSLLFFISIMPGSHRHINLSRKSHACQLSRKRAGHRPHNSHVDPITATRLPCPIQLKLRKFVFVALTEQAFMWTCDRGLKL